uniref:Large ribosomal subunit protein uL22m n=1 Tax=Culicoides sonorensis TaxID=179676 RepID=A0A336MMY7_CULSO
MSLLKKLGASIYQAKNEILLVGKPNLGVISALFHTSSPDLKNHITGPKRFLKYNKTFFPPQSPDEEPRKAYVCHVKENIRYSPKKMWYIASFVRGMSVDEAVKQLSFVLKRGASAVKETILEAQEMAVTKHNVEYKTNLWVAESFCTKGKYFRGIRRHARMRYGIVDYKHCHYFVRLEEGTPPVDYYQKALPPPKDRLEDWMNKMRNRKITNSL